MNGSEEKRKPKTRIGRKYYLDEYRAPSVRWVDNASCPICGGENLMDALGMALCVKCNKFVRPKKKG